MVTKLIAGRRIKDGSSVLAKIHMVTKLNSCMKKRNSSSVLAKIHMVTKLFLLLRLL